METPRSYKYWSKTHLKILRRFYPNVENERIAKRLKRTVPSIVTKAHRLRLKKSEKLIKMIARDNILKRYEDRMAG